MLSLLVTLVGYAIAVVFIIIALLVTMLLVGTFINDRKHPIKKPILPSIADNETAANATLIRQSASQLARQIRNREITSVQATRAFIAQIQHCNPKINAVCSQRFAAALQDAESADTQLAECYAKSGNGSDAHKLAQLLDALPPFHGVPCSIKECFAYVGMSWSSGLVSRADLIPQQDATAVKRMKEAGFIPLVNTNTSELCMWYESNNFVFGRTNNPYDQDRIGMSNPCSIAIVNQSNPIQSNPIQSNPIQSNPIQSNPIRAYDNQQIFGPIKSDIDIDRGVWQ
jgi:hypothetical protein